jgi:tetratricopeptide (TPR) repeat protein
MMRFSGVFFCIVFGLHVGFSIADQQFVLPSGYIKVQELPAQIIDRVSKDKVVLARENSQTSEATKVYLLDGSDNIFFEAPSALPAVPNAFSPSSYDGFNIAISKRGDGFVNVMDVQGEWTAVKAGPSSDMDSILLATKEDGNGIYNYNLLFHYDSQVKKVVLHDIYLNVNDTSCDQSLLATYQVNSVLELGASFESFDGTQAFRTLKAAYGPLQSGDGGLRKVMPVVLIKELKDALDAYAKNDSLKLKELMGSFIVSGGEGKCSPDDYVVKKYFFPDMIGWSNDLGFLLGQTGHFAESIELLKKVVATNPDRVVAYLNLADSYWGHKDFELAISNYTQYQSLMVAANKRSKIPARVLVRLK